MQHATRVLGLLLYSGETFLSFGSCFTVGGVFLVVSGATWAAANFATISRANKG
jgi:hypothetical protein